jgi:hypothetical protein
MSPAAESILEELEPMEIALRSYLCLAKYLGLLQNPTRAEFMNS